MSQSSRRRSHPAMLRLRAVLAILLALGAPAYARAQLPAAPASSIDRIHFGGYAAVSFRRALDSSAVRLAEGNIAAIISGSLGSRVSYLAELDAVSSSRQNYAGRQDDRSLEVARAYVDVSQGDLLRLRVGRYLTPIGQWNEIHAEPLTWTAVRPVATYRSFAKYSTGALVAGQGVIAGHDAGYALWFAPALSAAGEDDEAELEFHGAMGARVAMEPLRGLWLGASGAVVRERRPASSFDDDSLVLPPGMDDDSLEGGDEQHGRALLGADLTARARGVELRIEATLLRGNAVQRDERTAFAQLVAPLVGGLSAVGRAEYTSTASGDARVWLTGIHWRAPRGLVVKLERQDAGRAPKAVASGWFISVSSLF